MKYLVMGHSGSGKSSLTKMISETYKIPLLYMDCVHFERDWKSRDDAEAIKIVEDFMKNNDSWVIDGNYFKLEFEERVKQADTIIYLNFNRFNCLKRAYKRYFEYKGKRRESISEGCYESMDFEFISWILFEGRTRKRLKRFNEIKQLKDKKVIELKNQKELDKFVSEMQLKA